MKFKEAINTEKPVLVDFYATWCGPCQTMAPLLDQLKKKLGEAVTILKVDVDKNPQVAARFNISSVPTFILFRSGAVKWRQSGIVSSRQLEEAVQHAGDA